jgi:3-phenylpropionate/trans-cinnamate dioxygenase ferredoxin reductase subunit
MLRRIVVVGASLAGLRAVEALRRDGFDGELCLIGAEPHLPYDRPPLSKQILRGEFEPAKIALRSEADLRDLALELRLGVRATALDGARGTLALSDGSEVAYDGMLIATGAAARALPFGGTAPALRGGASFGQDLAGVHLLRSLDDALAIRAELAARPRVCVIGAGFIGLEVAASCRKLGLSVSAVELLSLPLINKLGARMAAELTALHQRNGVEFYTGVGVAGWLGKARVERVLLSDGRSIEADLVVIGVGVRPETAWLAGSGVQIGDGVLCDATCATALPNVVAAGDVARWHDARLGTSLRVEHWTHAVEMANHAVQRLLAGPSFVQPFTPVPYFWSDQYDVKLQFAGSAHEGDTLEVIESAPLDGKLVALYGRAGRLVGALTWNRPAQLVRYRRQIAQGAAFDAVVQQARTPA